MKKLLFLAAMLLGFVACNNEDNSISPDVMNLDISEEWNDFISSYYDFDPLAAPGLFTGKTWRICYEAFCDEDYNIEKLWFSYLCSPVKQIPPGGNLYEYDLVIGDEADPEKEWSYNPETKTLIFSKYYPLRDKTAYYNYEILSLSEQMMMCNYSFEDLNTGQMVYRRHIYVTIETWEELCKNF